MGSWKFYQDQIIFDGEPTKIYVCVSNRVSWPGETIVFHWKRQKLITGVPVERAQQRLKVYKIANSVWSKWFYGIPKKSLKTRQFCCCINAVIEYKVIKKLQS